MASSEEADTASDEVRGMDYELHNYALNNVTTNEELALPEITGNGEIFERVLEGRDHQLRQTCMKYGVEFDYPKDGESPEETKVRRENLQRKCKAARQRQKRLEMSPESREMLRARQAERMRLKRSQMTAEERRISRQQQAEKMRFRRKSLTSEQLKHSLAHRAKLVRENRRKNRLLKLQVEGNNGIKSAIAAGLDAEDLKILKMEYQLNECSVVKVIDVVVEENVCGNCGKKMVGEKMPSAIVFCDTIHVFNFGEAPVEVVQKFQKFRQSYSSLSEALLDLLEKERFLFKKYHFIPNQTKQKIFGIATKQDYPDVLQTTIRALKELTKNSKYISVACTIEELLCSSDSFKIDTFSTEPSNGALSLISNVDASSQNDSIATNGNASREAGGTPAESNTSYPESAARQNHQIV